MAQERNASTGDKSESRRLGGRAMSYLAQASECRAMSQERRGFVLLFLPKADAAERCGPLVNRRLKNCCDRVCLPVAPRSTSKSTWGSTSLEDVGQSKEHTDGGDNGHKCHEHPSVNLPFALRTRHLQFLTFQACRNPKCRFDSFKRNRTF